MVVLTEDDENGEPKKDWVESMGSMAGYGGPEKAACAAISDYWTGYFTGNTKHAARHDLEAFVLNMGCYGESKGMKPKPGTPGAGDTSAGYDISLDGTNVRARPNTHLEHEDRVQLVIATDAARVDEPNLPHLPRTRASAEQLRAWLRVADPGTDYEGLPAPQLWDAVEAVLTHNGYLHLR